MLDARISSSVPGPESCFCGSVTGTSGFFSGIFLSFKPNSSLRSDDKKILLKKPCFRKNDCDGSPDFVLNRVSRNLFWGICDGRSGVSQRNPKIDLTPDPLIAQPERECQQREFAPGPDFGEVLPGVGLGLISTGFASESQRDVLSTRGPCRQNSPRRQRAALGVAQTE